MKKYCISVLIAFNVVTVKAQTLCAEVRNRSDAVLKALRIYEPITNPTQKEFDEFNAIYTNFRDFAIKTAATETDYDIKILLQVFALQNANHFLAAAGRQEKYDVAWKEMKIIHDELYTKINYQKLFRKDNWVGCSISSESKKLEIYESTYKDMCTDFIALSCKIVLHYKKDQLAATLFAEAGFRGLLNSSSLLHTIAGEILNQRINNNQLDDTTYLAAYKFLLTNNEPQSLISSMSDFSNLTVSKALDVIINPTLVARSNVAPLKNVDAYEKISYRYDHLYSYLAMDSAFKFSGKFDVLKIALANYLTEIRSIKIDNHSFWHVPGLYQLLDRGYESGDGYGVRKEMLDILNSGNNDLLNMLAQVYGLYGNNCIGSYPTIEKSHHYYSAYLCYRAMGDSKKAKKAFNDIPNSMLANDRKGTGGYRKID